MPQYWSTKQKHVYTTPALKQLTNGSLKSHIHTHWLQLLKQSFVFAFAPHKWAYRVSSHSPMAIKQAAKRPAPVLHNSRVRKKVASDVIPLQVTRTTTLIRINVQWCLKHHHLLKLSTCVSNVKCCLACSIILALVQHAQSLALPTPFSILNNTSG